MYQKVVCLSKPTMDEYHRLAEIRLCLFIQHMIKNYTDPYIVLDYIETLARLFDCDFRVIQNITLEVLQGIKQYHKDHRYEHVVLLYKHGIPLRQICAKLHVCNNQVYDYVNKYKDNPVHFDPVFPAEQRSHIVKFMAGVEKLSYAMPF